MAGLPTERFAALVDALSGEPGVQAPGDSPGKKKFGSDALKVGGSIFAMLTQDRLVVKLPKHCVDALVAAGHGARLEMSRGRPMKEWLSLDPGAPEDWLDLSREALTYVRSGRVSSGKTSGQSVR